MINDIMLRGDWSVDHFLEQCKISYDLKLVCDICDEVYVFLDNHGYYYFFFKDAETNHFAHISLKNAKLICESFLIGINYTRLQCDTVIDVLPNGTKTIKINKEEN